MVSKRRRSFDPNQQTFNFDTLDPKHHAEAYQCDRVEGQLEGIERRVSSAVAQILADCAKAGRSRYDVAGGMSELLRDDVTKGMLDAYASEARETHNISLGRFLALVAETGAYDVLSELLAPIGAGVFVGPEIATVQLGHVQAKLRELKELEGRLRKVATPMTRRKR